MAKQRLTDRIITNNVSLTDLVHIVKTGDTSQNPAGSSYATTIQNVVDTLSASTVTGLTFDNFTYDLTLSLDNGVTFNSNLSILASDIKVTGGTYNPALGEITFVNNSGGTFVVSGISSNYLSLSGGTVTGTTNFTNGLISNTISATTYLNLPFTADTNFANTDLTFTGNRTHEIGASNYLYITNDPTFGSVSSFLFMTSGETQIGNYDITSPLYLGFSGGTSYFQSNTNKVFSVINNLPGNEIIINESKTPGTIFIVKGGLDDYLIYSDPVNDRIGIGTNIPSEKLEVSGNTKITGGLNIGFVGSTTPITNLGIDVNGNVVSGITGGNTFTGGTVNGSTIFTNGLTANSLTVNGVQITGDTYVTGGTYSNGTLTFTDNQNNTFQVTGVTSSGGSGTFTGNTSATCITDLFITNLHGCSPITVWDGIQSLNSYSNGILSFSFGENVSADGDYSHAEGHFSNSVGKWSHAEGASSNSVGNYSHAEGFFSVSNGEYSHAEGYETNASGYTSHAEGRQTKSIGEYSHAEGVETTAFGDNSHSEGFQTYAGGSSSHAEGSETIAYGGLSHAEGKTTKSSGEASHAEGYLTISEGNYSHSEGVGTLSLGIGSHAEGGYLTLSPFFIYSGGTAYGTGSHAEGRQTFTYGGVSHAEGEFTVASGDSSHSEGVSTLTIGYGSHAEGSGTTASGDYSHAEGGDTISYGLSSHAEGVNTIASGSYSHAEGISTSATTFGAHSEGYGTLASGILSKASGYQTQALFIVDIAEGWQTIADGSINQLPNQYGAHAEGVLTKAYGGGSHAEGAATTATGTYSHAEGGYNLTTNTASGSHAEGFMNTAYTDYSHVEGAQNKTQGLIPNTGRYSHAEGRGTIAYEDYQHVSGRFNNTSNANQYFIIGGGTSDVARANLLRVSSNGNLNIAGTLTQSSADYAEYFESLSGDSLPFGTVVELVGKKIKVCENPNNAIGVISSNPSILGNAEEGTADEWNDKYEKDEWGRHIMEDIEIEIPVGVDYENKIIYEKTIQTVKKISINYNPNIPYIPRSERPEWNVVGLLGQIRILKNQQIPSRWIKMEDINDEIALYLVR